MENLENVEMNTAQSRRTFLKKAAYVAPAVVALGALTIPASAQASVFTTEWKEINTGQIYTVSVDGNSATGVVSSGSSVNTASGKVKTYTAEQVVTNDTPLEGFWSYFKQWFPSIT